MVKTLDILIGGGILLASVLPHYACGPPRDPISWRSPHYESKEKENVFKQSLVNGNLPREQTVLYAGLYELAKQKATEEEKFSPTYDVLKKIEHMRLPNDKDSLDAAFSALFLAYDPKPGKPNEFVTEQVAERAAWITEYGGFLPGQTGSFDDLGRDILVMGVPKILGRGINSYTVFFPNANLTRFYVFDESKSRYVARALDSQAHTLTCREIKMPSPSEISHSQRQNLEKVEGKIHTEIEHKLLENTVVEPYVFPRADPRNPRDSIWNTLGFVVDVFSRLKDITYDKKAQATASYVLTNVSENRVEQTDTLHQPPTDVTGADLNQDIRFRIDLPLGHRRTGERGITHYELALDIESAGKHLVRSVGFSLPRDTTMRTINELKFVSPDQRGHKKTDPLPFFLPPQELERGKTYTAFMPVTGLGKNSDTYEGLVDLLLVPESQKRGMVGRATEFSVGTFGDTTISVEKNQGYAKGRNYPVPPLATDTLRSNAPNLYYQGSFTIPKDADVRKEYILIGWAYTLDENGNAKIISEGNKEGIKIK